MSADSPQLEMLARIDEIPWATLEASGGHAGLTPDVLRTLATSTDETARAEACNYLETTLYKPEDRLIFPATAYAVPFVIALARSDETLDPARLVRWLRRVLDAMKTEPTRKLLEESLERESDSILAIADAVPGGTYLLFETTSALAKVPISLSMAADALVPSTVGELLSIASTYRASPLQHEAALALVSSGQESPEATAAAYMLLRVTHGCVGLPAAVWDLVTRDRLDVLETHWSFTSWSSGNDVSLRPFYGRDRRLELPLTIAYSRTSPMDGRHLVDCLFGRWWMKPIDGVPVPDTVLVGTWSRQIVVISDVRYELDDEGRVIEGRAFPHRR